MTRCHSRLSLTTFCMGVFLTVLALEYLQRGIASSAPASRDHHSQLLSWDHRGKREEAEEQHPT